MSATSTGSPTVVVRGRCRCGHFPTHHVRVRPVEGSANYRLDLTGPCAICGESVCRLYTPALG